MIIIIIIDRPKKVCLLFLFTSGSGMNIPLWDFVGSTMVTGNYIRLTPDHQSKQGAIWNSVVSTEYLN